MEFICPRCHRKFETFKELKVHKPKSCRKTPMSITKITNYETIKHKNIIIKEKKRKKDNNNMTVVGKQYYTNPNFKFFKRVCRRCDKIFIPDCRRGKFCSKCRKTNSKKLSLINEKYKGYKNKNENR